jgi:formylglycine-generating enzyme required for sulfatase activity
MLALAVLLCLSCQRVEPPNRPAVSPEIITTETGFEMVLIPAGSFPMGSEAGEPDEAPVHEVWVDAFMMDRYEVTQEQFTKLAAGNAYLARDPSHFKGPRRPVEMVSWPDAALLCNERSRAEGLEPCYDEQTGVCNFDAGGYRLPTEADWEYACRAGSRTSYYFGPDPRQLGRYAWYKPNAAGTTQPVGQKEPNAWGLFDMLGNVAEWCNDVYDADYYRDRPTKNPRGPAEGDKYILRGGAWNSSAEASRSAFRVGEDPGFEDACFARDAIGFRCVRRAE